METLIIQTGPESMAVIPLQAVASWSALRGVTEEEAIDAILAEDEPGGDGWTGLYDSLSEFLQVKGLVDSALSGRVRNDGGESIPSAVFSAMGRFGPEVVVAHTNAFLEERQRQVLPRCPRNEEARAMVRDKLETIRALSLEFQDQLVPDTLASGSDTIEA